MKRRFAFASIVGCFACLATALCQQVTPIGDNPPTVRSDGIPYDWTHSHVFFSASPDDRRDEVAARLDPRYILQQLRRKHAADQAPSPVDDLIGSWRHKQSIQRDWAQSFQTGGTAYTFTSPTYPAKFAFSSEDPTPDCNADYVVFTLPTGTLVFPGNFNIIAYNNLYVSAAGSSKFCPGTAPTAMFAYNASSAGGPLNGSPALSLDGTAIAFVENATVGNGGAVFHVMKWHDGDLQTLDLFFPLAFNLFGLANCATNGAAAPCEYNVQYTPTGSRATATLSSPFIDYHNDVAYLSDDVGNVYAIAPIFTATPGTPPVVLAGWPVNVGASVVLTPPVYDGRSKNIFVASTGGTEYFIKASGSITGSCASGSPPCVGSNTFAFTGGGTVRDAPVVDSSTGRVWLFGTQSGGTAGSYVVQTDAQLSAVSVVQAAIGTGTANPIHPGSPDNNYFTSVATGKFYACGQNASGVGQLYAFGFNSSGVMNTAAVAGSPLLLANSAAVSAPCTGPLTEIFNQSASKDWLFAGVKNRCVNTIGATNGCVMSFDTTSAFPSVVANQLPVPGGATGIVVDNVTDASGTKITTDIYFMLLGTQSCLDYNGTAHMGTCAVSATQSGLQ